MLDKIFNIKKDEKRTIFTVLGIKFRCKNDYKYTFTYFVKKLFFRLFCLTRYDFLLPLTRFLGGLYAQRYSVKYQKFTHEEIFDLFKVKTMYPTNILSVEDTIDKILSENLSVSRFGDGEEFGTMVSDSPELPELKERLDEICKTGSTESCLVCINNFNVDNEKRSPLFRNAYMFFYLTHLKAENLKKIKFCKDKDYGDAYSFLCYFELSETPEQFLRKKARVGELWKNRKVLFVLSENSDILKDTECFSEVKEKAYIFGPSEWAFSEYPRIMSEIKENYDTSWLIYLELGSAATVLSYDLSEAGYQALDMGGFYSRIYKFPQEIYQGE